MDKVVPAIVGLIGAALSLNSFFSARTRAYTLANQSFTLAKLLQDQDDSALDGATRRTAVTLRKEALARGHRATHDFLAATQPGRPRTLIEALGLLVNVTIFAVGVFGMRVPDGWQVWKFWVAGILVLAGVVGAALMVRSGNKRAERDRDLEDKGRPELAVAEGALK